MRKFFAVVIGGLMLTSAAADASFKGVLKRGVEFQVAVDNTGNLPGEKVGITILKINQKGKIVGGGHLTIDGGQGSQLKDTAAATIERVIIFVNPTFGKVTPITVTQGCCVSFADPGNGDAQLVFDTAP